MNIRLWELDNGNLIDLSDILKIGRITDHGSKTRWYIDVISKGNNITSFFYKTEDEAKLARFKLVERWNACLDMIYSQTWCPESGTYSSSSKPIKEDNFGGYKEKDH